MKSKKPIDYDEALSMCASLCARGEQCTPELKVKMQKRGLGFNDIEKVISRLIELRFVDDDRFARTYAHHKMAYSGWGRNKIIQGLWAKHLQRSSINQCMDEIEDEEYEAVAERIIRTKLRLSPPDILSTYEGRIKVLKYAMQRGFEARLAGGIINRIIREMRNDET